MITSALSDLAQILRGLAVIVKLAKPKPGPDLKTELPPRPTK